ncbi:MAG: response regulator [Bacteroidota bacterium]
MTHKLKCIMLIDDDEDDNFFHKREITDNDLADAVIVQDSATKALEYLKTKKNPLSDLIFLDINMPRMNGWEFLTEYNKLDKELQSKAIIIMLSTSENPSDVAKAKSWDFVADYITKPLTKKLLEGVIDKYFN